MNSLVISSIFLLLVSNAFASHRWQQYAQRYEEQTPVEQTVYNAPQAYKFAYTTGLQGVSDVAQHFREESRDESGYVVGKYGYVDPYGKLRIVNYRAGPEGYTASGDIGADEEGLRQQRELYSTDRSYQIQQQVWQALAAGQPIEGILASAGSSAASSASASASSSSSSSGAAQSEWTSVGNGHEHTADYTNVKGGNRFAERYTAAGGVKSPVAHLRATSANSVNSIKSSSNSAASSAAYYAPAPVVTQTVHTTKTAPLVVKTARYVQPAVTQTVYHTKTVPVQTIQVVKPAQIIQTTKTVQPAYTGYYQSPAARLVSFNNNNSALSASASAAASASASSSATSGAYTAGIKGYSGAIRTAPVRSGRYAVVPSGGRTVVNFQQGGPVPYRYSYAFK